MKKGKENINKLPEKFRIYFWHTNFDKIDIKLHARAVITQLMLFANDKTVEWINQTYDKELILDVLNTAHALRTNEIYFPAEKRKKLEDYFIAEKSDI